MSFCVNIPNNELRCLDIREKLANPFYMGPKNPCYTEYNYSKGALVTIPLCLQLKESSRRNWSQLSSSEKTKLILKKVKLFAITVFFVISFILVYHTENNYKKCLANVQIACC